MKLLQRTGPSTKTTLLLIVLSLPGFAQAEQDSIRTFSWEGLSLSMTLDQMESTLKSDGYKQVRVTKKISIYQRKTETGSNKVQFNKKNGALIKLIFSESRTGGKKNILSAQAANRILESIKSKLGIDKSSCTQAVKGGGKCNGQPGSSTHTNSFSVSVKPRALKITVASNPIAQVVIDFNNEVSDGLASAYACFSTTEITSIKEVYDCVRSSSISLSKMPQGRGHQNGVNLESPVTRCSHLTDFYKRGLASVTSTTDINEIDNSLIPDCSTFAEVIERATGRPPYWSNCISPDNDGDSIKACIEGYNPSLVNGIKFYLPSCKKLQLSYKVSVTSGQPESKGYKVSVPNCERLASLAKKWRPELPEDLKPCEGYNSEKTSEHVNACLAPEKMFIRLKNCDDVRTKYRQYVSMANGSLPDDYYALPCDQAKPTLARSEALREQRRKEAEALAKKMAKREKLVQQEKKQYIQDIKDKMAKKYADSPQNIASRTSALEKQIKSTGKTPTNCGENYCAPSLEEIRLAMMRYQSRKISLKIITGHLLYGKKPTAATIFMMMGGQQGKGMIGMELYYKEAQLIYDCKLKEDAYECYFKLPFNTQYDELTSLYMDGLTSGLPFNLNDMLLNMMGNSMAVEEYSYLFKIDVDGLWRATPTAQQKMRDLEKKIDAIDTGHYH